MYNTLSDPCVNWGLQVMTTRRCRFLYGNKCLALEWDGGGGELCMLGQEYMGILYSTPLCYINLKLL